MAKKAPTKKSTGDMGDISLVSNISTKLLKKLEIGEKATIKGRVKDATVTTTQFGSQHKFRGEFGAELPDGTKYFARSCYLPANFADMIAEAHAEANGQPVEFIVEIGKVESDKTKQGYVWSINPKKSPVMASTPAIFLLE